MPSLGRLSDGSSKLKMSPRPKKCRLSTTITPSRSKMRARVVVDETRRRSTGPTRSGLIRKSRSRAASGGCGVSRNCNSSSLSGSMTIWSVSMLAADAMAAAMMWPWVIRLCTRASIRLWRDWLE
jgi:hypothetical protein